MKIRNLFENINISGKISFDKHMSEYTSFKVGGPAEVLIEPETAAEIVKITKLCRENQI